MQLTTKQLNITIITIFNYYYQNLILFSSYYYQKLILFLSYYRCYSSLNFTCYVQIIVFFFFILTIPSRYLFKQGQCWKVIEDTFSDLLVTIIIILLSDISLFHIIKIFQHLILRYRNSQLNSKYIPNKLKLKYIVLL